MGWLRNLLFGSESPDAAADAPTPTVEPQPDRPPLPLPELRQDWARYAERLGKAMSLADIAGLEVCFLYEPDHGTGKVSLYRKASESVGPDGWRLKNSEVPFPNEALMFFRLHKSGRWIPGRSLSNQEAARATAVLLSYIYPGPEYVHPTNASSRDSYLTANDPLIASISGYLSHAGPRPRGRGPKPQPRLIRTPHDAELVAADWVRWFGYTNVGVTPIGPDGGVDVFSDQVISQVKMEGVPTGRPVIQNAYGVAVAEGKSAIVFSLGGYVRTAIHWADEVKMPLFQFDLQGTPTPANEAAAALMGK